MAHDAREGGPGAMGPLYIRILPSVFVWARHRVPQSLYLQIAPEDLVQEIWCRAARSLGAFDPEQGSFRQWIFGIARRTLQDGLRRLARRVHRAGTGAGAGDGAPVFRPEDVPEEVTSVSGRLAKDEAVEALLRWVEANLGEPERVLLFLRGFERRPFKEVAEDLGCSPAAAEKRWERLLERIRSTPRFEAFIEP